MKNAQKQQGRAPSPTDYDATLIEQDRYNATAQPPLKSQVILSMKLFFIGGAAVLALWLIDYAVTP
jgi:hypothetical protein